ncbi:MAG TPA: hypothetical protein VMJ10_08935 [Kofleriaceae bacterium]|nr:hypothetical protein [Kofleriaceae bacterium]
MKGDPEQEYRKLKSGVLLVEVSDHLRVRFRGPEVRLENAWWGNYGGRDLVVSPDERYLAVSIYSGQSTQGYELFQLSPELKHVGGLPDTGGEGTEPCFSPDSKWLALVLSAVGERWRDEAKTVLDWAMLYLRPLPDGPRIERAIGTPVPRSFDRDELAEWNLFDRVRWASPTTLELTLPWDERMTISLPIEGPITTPPFTPD